MSNLSSPARGWKQGSRNRQCNVSASIAASQVGRVHDEDKESDNDDHVGDDEDDDNGNSVENVRVDEMFVDLTWLSLATILWHSG